MYNEQAFANVLLYWASNLESKTYLTESQITLDQAVKNISGLVGYDADKALKTLYHTDSSIRIVVGLYNTFYLLPNGYEFLDSYGNTLKDNIIKELKELSND